MYLNVRYTHEPGCCIWPIPFAFAKPGDIGVVLIDESGLERKLVNEVDYQICESQVVAFVPPGHSISIYLAAQVSLAGNAARVLQAGPQYLASQQVIQTEPVIAQGFQAGQQAALQNAGAVQSAAGSGEVALNNDALRAEIREEAGRALQETQDQLNALLGRLKELEEEKATALVAARQAEADAQIKAVRAAGVASVDDIGAETDLGLEAVELAASEAEKKMKRQAAALLVQTVEANDAAERIREATAAAAASTEENLAKIAQDLATAQSQLDAAIAANAKSLANQTATAQAQIAAASRLAAAEAEAASRLAGQSCPSFGYLRLAEASAYGTALTLPEPLAYWPGRNSLSIVVNGFVLTPGLDFEEIGQAASTSNTVRILRKLDAGYVLSFFISPTNVGWEAGLACERAEEAAGYAAEYRSRCESIASQVRELGDKTLACGERQLERIRKDGQAALDAMQTLHTGNMAELSRANSQAASQSAALWKTASDNLQSLRTETDQAIRKQGADALMAIADARSSSQEKAEAAEKQAASHAAASEALAEQAYRLSQCAWRAAYQASVDNARPGIASVPSVAELASHVSGVYFINPHLHSHTPFMGVWPIRSLAEATFDGVFFFGAPYEDMPDLPDAPPYPQYPQDAPQMQPLASGKDWLPCGHSHGVGQ